MVKVSSIFVMSEFLNWNKIKENITTLDVKCQRFIHHLHYHVFYTSKFSLCKYWDRDHTAQTLWFSVLENQSLIFKWNEINQFKLNFPTFLWKIGSNPPKISKKPNFWKFSELSVFVFVFDQSMNFQRIFSIHRWKFASEPILFALAVNVSPSCHAVGRKIIDQSSQWHQSLWPHFLSQHSCNSVKCRIAVDKRFSEWIIDDIKHFSKAVNGKSLKWINSMRFTWMRHVCP